MSRMSWVGAPVSPWPFVGWRELYLWRMSCVVGRYVASGRIAGVECAWFWALRASCSKVVGVELCPWV
eukprot:977991-Alexandrium_andersonii.AAC.1